MENFIVKKFGPALSWFMFNCPPGPPLLPMCYIVNFMKGATLPVCLLLMARFDNWSSTAYLITALHGSYGLLWCLKHRILPDRFWWTKATFMSCLNSVIVLTLYWSAAFLTISQHVVASPLRLFMAVNLYVFGVVTMMASDTQKYFVLKVRKGLINDGWFKTCRNTNYLGEMLLYSSFAVLSKSWVPWAINGSVWSTIFLSRWMAKDDSFRRKIGGPEYLRLSSLILPFPLCCPQGTDKVVETVEADEAEGVEAAGKQDNHTMVYPGGSKAACKERGTTDSS